MTDTNAAAPIYAEIGVQGWYGIVWRRVEVIGMTAKRYRIRAIERTRLAGRHRWLQQGDTALVPMHALRFPKEVVR